MEVCTFARMDRYLEKDYCNLQPVHFLNHKCCSLGAQKKKPARIRWTTAWRRNNKKAEVFFDRAALCQATEKSKRRSRKSFKVQKAIAGMSVNDIQKKKDQKTEIRNKSREAILAYQFFECVMQ